MEVWRVQGRVLGCIRMEVESRRARWIWAQYSGCGNIHDTGNFYTQGDWSQGCMKNEDNYTEGTLEGNGRLWWILIREYNKQLEIIRSKSYWTKYLETWSRKHTVLCPISLTQPRWPTLEVSQAFLSLAEPNKWTPSTLVQVSFIYTFWFDPTLVVLIILIVLLLSCCSKNHV